MNPLSRFVEKLFSPAAGGHQSPAAGGLEVKKSAVSSILSGLARTQLIGFGGAQWTGRTYDQLVREGYRKNAIAHRSVRIVAECAASVPLQLYRGDERLTRHPLLDLLKRPNPLQSGIELMESLIAFLQIAGNTYMEAAELADGRPGELYVLRPDRMRIVPGANGWPARYEYKVAGRTMAFQVDQASGSSPVMHLKTFHPTDDYYGLSPLEAAAFGIDAVTFTHAPLNLSVQKFLIADWSLKLAQDEAGNQGLVVEELLVEEDDAIYDWDETTDEITVAAPDTQTRVDTKQPDVLLLVNAPAEAGADVTENTPAGQQAVLPSQNLLGPDAGVEFTDAGIGGFDKRYLGSGAGAILISALGLEVGDIASGLIAIKTTGDMKGRAVFRWLDNAGGLIRQDSAALVDTGGAWGITRLENKTVPAGTVRVEFDADDDNGATNGDITWRWAMFNRGPIALPFEEPPIRGQREDASDLSFVGGESVEALKPADAGATLGALSGPTGNLFRDDGETKVTEPDFMNFQQEWGDVQDTGGTRPENNATPGATWGVDLGDRPPELTDGRIPAGLSAAGNFKLDVLSTATIAGVGAATVKNDAQTGRALTEDNGTVVHKSSLSGVGEQLVHKGTTPPADTNRLWLDTSTVPNVWKRHDGATWIKGTPTGALATLNSVDFLTLVDGPEKPANNATDGADWGANLDNRPPELTDGRVSAGLDGSGNLISTVDGVPVKRALNDRLGYLEFDGTNFNRVQIPHDSSFGKLDMRAAGNFFASVWVWFNSTGQHIFLSKRTSNTGEGWMMFRGTTNVLRLIINDGINPDLNITGTTTLTENRWYWVAVKKETSSDITLWLDGVQEGSTLNNTSDLLNTGKMKLGGPPDSNFTMLNGRLRDFWVSDSGGINPGNLINQMYGPLNVTKRGRWLLNEGHGRNVDSLPATLTLSSANGFAGELIGDAVKWSGPLALTGLYAGITSGGHLTSNRLIDDGGSNFKPIGFAASTKSVEQGESFTFANPWNQIPKLSYNIGGSATFSASLSGSQYPKFSVTNLTTSGGTVSLRIQETNGSPEVVTEEIEVAASTDEAINKGDSAVALDNNYTYSITVTVAKAGGAPSEPIPSSVTMEYYVDTGSGMVLIGTKVFNNIDTTSDKTFTANKKTLNITGMIAGDDFGVSKGSEFGGTSTFVDFVDVSYTKGTAGASVDAQASTTGEQELMLLGLDAGEIQ